MDKKLNWDLLGITTSLACAIHCAILPLVLTSLPVFGINIIENFSFELGMIVLAGIIGCVALLHGYRKHHRQGLPLVIFCAGIVLLVAKQLLHSWQLFLLLPAVLLILTAHLLNYRLCRKDSLCCRPETDQ